MKYYNCYEDPDLEEIYLIIDHLKNGELTKKNFKNIFEDIKEGITKMTEKQARICFRQIVEGVFYCKNLFKRLVHTEALVAHRDLKPENLMIHQDKSIKIIDFGISDDLSDKNRSRDRYKGSPFFMPPECFKGNLFLIFRRRI